MQRLEDNWGRCPLNDAEIDMLAEELNKLLSRNTSFSREEKDGKTETIGFTLTLPDINQAFKPEAQIPKGTMNLRCHQESDDK